MTTPAPSAKSSVASPFASMTPARMPGPRSRDAPRFEGRKLTRFLEEFEVLAAAADLKDKQKCEYLLRYCRGEAEEFVESLEEYVTRNWTALAKKLVESYPPDDEERHYTIRTLVTFVKQDRTISDTSSFDKYNRRFGVISRALDRKKMLAERNRDDYFFKGVKPVSLRKRITTILERDSKWTDFSGPPPMENVIEVARKHLQKDRYHIEYDLDDDYSQDSDNEADSIVDNGNSSSDDEEHNRDVSRSYGKKETNRKRSGTTDVKPITETNKETIDATDDLTKRLERLSIMTENIQRQMSTDNRRPQQFSSGPRICYMCGENTDHSMRECPETIAFLAAGAIKKDSEGRLVRLDGSPLPRGKAGEGGIAVLLKAEAANRKGRTSSIEVERNYTTANATYEFAQLSAMDTSYQVMPAERMEKSYKNNPKPYDKVQTRSETKRNDTENKDSGPLRKPNPKPQVFVEVPPPPKILKRPTIEVVPEEDEEMPYEPPKSTKKPPPPSARADQPTRPMDKGKRREHVPHKTTFDDVELKDKKDVRNEKAKRASPSFKFSSELQQGVDQDLLLEKILNVPITVKLREVLSSYELAKRIQAISKTQKIPMDSTQKVHGTSLATVTTIEEDMSDEGSDLHEVRIRNLEYNVSSITENGAHVEKFPETFSLMAHNVEIEDYASDNESDTTEQKAESYYQQLLAEEYERENGNKEEHEVYTATRTPRFLAMVTGKITTRIAGEYSEEMLLDCGSELNIITEELQVSSGLPLDPSGANWSLRGVSGDPLKLVGLCRNVPVEIGGLRFDHNFFVARGLDRSIVGQPWFFDHAARFDYLPTSGVHVQIWENGDRTANSVQISIPILNSPRNVFKGSAKQFTPRRKYTTASLSYMSTPMDEDNNPFTLRYKKDNHLVEWTPAVLSRNAKDGQMERIPTMARTIISAFDLHEPETAKFGPVSSEIDFVNKYVTLDDSICDALNKQWLLSEYSRTSTLVEHLTRIGLSKGYEDNEAQEFAQDFAKRMDSTRLAYGAKYKPVAKKILPVNTYDPKSIVPEYKRIELGEVTPLTISPTKLENVAYTTRLTKERIETMIGNIPNGFLSKTELELFVDIVLRHEKAFAFNDEERGTFSSEYFPDYIIRTVAHEPWQVKPIRLPHSRREILMEMLDEQMKAGKYELSSSSYRSGIFLVEKKGGKLRIVHDLQPLNQVTIRDSALPPIIDDITEDFKGYSFYFLADLKAGYDAVTLDKQSRALTAFYALDFGSMQLCTLPQGFTNSVAEFCRRTNHVLLDIRNGKVRVFVDDIAGKGPKTRYNERTIQGNSEIRQFVYEGLHTLEETLILVEKAGLTISGQKFVGATPELEILGCVVSLLGSHISHGAMAKISKWPVCTSVSEVRGFLGTVGVVRKWIKDFAKIAKPLTTLTQKAITPEFEWNDGAQNAMDILKEKARTAPPLIAIDYILASQILRPQFRNSDLGLVTLAVDSSVIGAGWIVSQIVEKGELPVVFGSVTFKEHESRYSQPKLELYGLFRAVKAERHRLYGIHFRIKVDARSLIEMVNKPDLLPNAPGNRWLAFINLFDFEIVHVPAERHKGPDGLSRRRHAEDDSDDSDATMDADDTNKFARSTGRYMEIEQAIHDAKDTEHSFEADKQFVIACLDRAFGECAPLDVNWTPASELRLVEGNQIFFEGTVNSIENDNEDKSDSNNVHEHYRPDNDSESYWDLILGYLLDLRLPSEEKEAKRVKGRAKNYFLMDNLLWKRNGTKPPLQVVLEPSRRLRLTSEAHDKSGHRGKDPTYKKLCDSFWWPNQYLYVKEYCRTCHQCQMRSSYRTKIPIEPTYVRTILRDFGADTVHMPLGKGGYKYIVDLRDKFTGWVEAKQTHKITSLVMADFIFEVMCRFGCLMKLTVDNGSEFKGAVTLLAEKYKLPLIPISPYNPPANGAVERGHSIWIESIWKATEGKTNLWPLLLNQALWADRITAKRTTGCSPYYLLYGQAPTLSFDITDRSWHALEWHKVKTTKDLLTLRIKQLSRRDEYIGEASAKMEAAHKKAADYFYEKNKARMVDYSFEPGTLVLVWLNYLDFQFGSKGALRWMGPYIVVQRRNSGAYVLAELDGVVLAKPVAARRIKLYHYRNIEKPMVRFEWRARQEDQYDILDEDEEDEQLFDEHQNRLVAKVARKTRQREGPDIKRPWELRGEEADEYWLSIYEDWKSGETARRAAANLPSYWEKAIMDWSEEDKQFWDYSWDYRNYDAEDMPRWLTPPQEKLLFQWKHGNEWLPPGQPTFMPYSKSVLIVDVLGPNFDSAAWAVLGEPRLVTICENPKKATDPIVDNGMTKRDNKDRNGTNEESDPKASLARQQGYKRKASRKGKNKKNVKSPQLPRHIQKMAPQSKKDDSRSPERLDLYSPEFTVRNNSTPPRGQGDVQEDVRRDRRSRTPDNSPTEYVERNPPRRETSPLTVTLLPREFEQIERMSQQAQDSLGALQTRQRDIIGLMDQFQNTLQDLKDDIEDIEIDAENASKDLSELVSVLKVRQREEWDTKQRLQKEKANARPRARNVPPPPNRTLVERINPLLAYGEAAGPSRTTRNQDFETHTTTRRKNLRSDRILRR